MNKKVILKVIIFSIAFAFVESSVVVYLRHLLGFAQVASTQEVLFLVPGIAALEPQTAIKIISDSAILNVERFREAATLIMLATVAALAGRSLQTKTAYFLLYLFEINHWLAQKFWRSGCLLLTARPLGRSGYYSHFYIGNSSYLLRNLHF